MQARIAAARERIRIPAVLRSPSFVRLWIAEVFRSLGGWMQSPAISLLSVNTLHASSAQMGVVSFLGTAPSTVLDLFAGVIADRIPRRLLLVTGYLLRGAAMVLLIAAFLSRHLQFWMLLVAIVVDAAGYSVSSVAKGSYLPMILKREQLIEANSALTIATSVAGMVAPSISGSIVQFAGAPWALAAVCAAFVIAAIIVRSIPERGAVVRAPRGTTVAAFVKELRDGLLWLWRDTLTRQLSVRLTAWYLISGALLSVDILYVIKSLGATPAQVGMFYSITAGALLAGSLMAKPLSAWLGVGRTIVLANFVVACAAALIPAASGHSLASLALAGVAYSIFGALGTVYGITNSSLRQAVVPPELLGRVTGATYLLVDGALSVGALVCGGLGSLIGVRPAIAGVVALGIVFSLFGLRNRRLWATRSLSEAQAT